MTGATARRTGTNTHLTAASGLPSLVMILTNEEPVAK